jgi:MoaA/NifB/PqqE/SkfB family radical SAM enzyme
VAERYFSAGTTNPCISTADRRRIAEALIAGGIKHISILGGEPFLLGDELFDILGLFKSHGISISLVTNGLLIDANAMEKLVRLSPERLVFSMEGPESETHDRMRGKGNFSKLVDIIKTFKESIENHGSGISININTVVTRRNMASVPSMIPFVRSLGADELSLLGLNCVGNASKMGDQLMLSVTDELEVSRKIADIYAENDNRQNLKLHINFIYPVVRDYLLVHENRFLPFPQICCSAASSLAYINPWGDMHPCDRIFMNKYDVHFSNPQGTEEDVNLKRAGFFDVWNSRYFLNTFAFVSEYASYGSYDPCLCCTYFQEKKCNPCPLDAMQTNRFPIESCLHIEKKSEAGLNTLIRKARVIDRSISSLTGGLDRRDEDIPGGMDPANRLPLPPPVDPKRIIMSQKGVRTAYMRGQQAYMLIHPMSGESLFMDPNGYKLWQLINEHPQTVQEICDQYFQQVSTVLNLDDSREIREKVHGNVEVLVATLVQKHFLVGATTP